MYNTMNGVNVADKLGLGPEVRELKIGTSFTAGGRAGQQQGSFHSVKYDFKPASVDTSKLATLDVGPNGQVTISMPNVDGNGTTVFKGARKPYAKECVLIIDHETGEVVLEKLTHNIQVKRTREEGGSKKSSGLAVPTAPPPSADIKKISTPTFKVDPPKIGNREDSKKTQSSSSSHHQQKKGPNSSPKPPHQPQRHSPNNGPSPGHAASPTMGFSSPAASSQESHRSTKHSQPNLLSLTNFEDLLTMAPMNPPSVSKPVTEKPPVKDSGGNTNLSSQVKSGSSGKISKDAPPAINVSALSESSSGEDSSSSSSSDDDDDSSDMEEVLDKVPIPPAPESNKSPVVSHNSRPKPPVAPSMPTDLLCEDLQLSESGSDSE